MNVSDYTYLLNHPEAINEKRTEELDKIVAEFPYFQSARALRLKGLYNEDSFRYNYALKVTAAFTGDRSVLFDFITSDSFTSVEKELYLQKQQELHGIDVSSETPELHAGLPIQEMTVDESFRASLDTEFVPAEEIAQDQHHQILETENGSTEIFEAEKPEETVFEEPSAEEVVSVKSEVEVAPEVSEEAAEIAETEQVPSENEESQEPAEFEVETASEEQLEAEDEPELSQSEETEEEPVETFEFRSWEELPTEEPETSGPDYDAATRSVLDSIKEAEQYAKSLLVTDVEEVQPQSAPEITEEVQDESQSQENSEAEKSLEIGKPLDFGQSEVHSFNEWLQLSQFQPIVRDEVVAESPQKIEEIQDEDDDSETDSERQKKNELIDKFIEANPKIPKITPETKAPSFIFEPTQADNSYLMTETLARVYLEQKKFDKAIQAYEILILKYPEKSSFFADRILDIKSLQQNNKL